MDFLRGIGLQATYEGGANGFIEGVRIDRGTLLVDPACRPSALLHEAGHLAITPLRFRTLMSDNLSAGMRAMFRVIEEMSLEPDHPLMRAAIQCSDPEATAWAWAAGLEIGLPENEIIQDDEYDGDGASIRQSLSMKAYVGINGLAHAGFCVPRKAGVLPMYPRLKFWTQEG
ncbi:hypothetical protein ACI2UK_13995 [Ralstonia nicotianae]|uniref:hypothetical protein n=1 Tax=Ralstonia pseudosolanacearum TaxID=1310165 RepID=UPI002005CAED|nr:hypothetical protein [Ralstonia pseudosolanacearum]